MDKKIRIQPSELYFLFLFIYLFIFFMELGSSRSDDGDGYENVTWKVNAGCFKLYDAYSISFNSSNVHGKCFWSWILKDCIKVQEKKRKLIVFCSRPRQNVKLGTCTL